jgi:hypothetical protein
MGFAHLTIGYCMCQQCSLVGLLILTFDILTATKWAGDCQGFRGGFRGGWEASGFFCPTLVEK